jgi:hypothetical protein
VLNEEFVLSSHAQLMNCLRHTNTSLRWLMLHYTTTNKKLREVITLTGTSSFLAARPNPSPLLSSHRERPDNVHTLTEIKLDGVLLLLLNVAQLEYMLKNMFQQILDAKDDKWNECRAQGAERMSELGTRPSPTPRRPLVRRHSVWLERARTHMSPAFPVQASTSPATSRSRASRRTRTCRSGSSRSATRSRTLTTTTPPPLAGRSSSSWRR